MILIFSCFIIGLSSVNAENILINSTDSISDAINSANSNDVIYLSEGVYKQNSIIINKDLTIVGNGSVILDINLIAGEYIITTMFNGLQQSNTITII